MRTFSSFTRTGAMSSGSQAGVSRRDPPTYRGGPEPAVGTSLSVHFNEFSRYLVDYLARGASLSTALDRPTR
jgi:hypothetical protein